MLTSTIVCVCLNLVSVIGTCPPATPTNYEILGTKYYIPYSTPKTYDDAKGLTGCPTGNYEYLIGQLTCLNLNYLMTSLGYRLMEWRDATDWASVVYYASDTQLGNPIWTGLWNRDGHDCAGTACHSLFVWRSDDSLQSYNPTDNIEGKSVEKCLQVSE